MLAPAIELDIELNIPPPPPIPMPIFRIILFRMYKLSKINTPIITAREIGNGIIIEIAILMPKDIAMTISWLMRNCLLLAVIYLLPI